MKKTHLIYASLGAACLLLGICYWVLYGRFHEYTDDAYVEGNKNFITPLRSGFITSIHIDDTFLVKKGQLLVTLDATDATIALHQAQETLAKTIREVSQLFHQTFAYQADIEIKRATFTKATQDLEHRTPVVQAGGVSVENYEHAVAAVKESLFALQMTELLYKKNLAMIQGLSIRNHPLVLHACDQFLHAWIELYRCKIYSPVDGLAAQRTAQVGMWVSAGTPLLSIISLDDIWVNANFKETQVRKIRLGQPVTLRSDLYGRNVIFQGIILGIPGGAGNVFSLLPPQNLSGNWIKIVQRLPVRVGIHKEALQHHPLRVGLSMTATVDLHNQAGEIVPTTNRDSLIYTTPIYQEEEGGAQEALEAIFNNNFDPSLTAYKTTPL